MNKKPGYHLQLLRHFALFMAITLGFRSETYTQQLPGDKITFNKKYLTSYWHDSKQIVAAPFHWKAKQWSAFAGIVGVTAAVYFYDNEIFDFAQRNKSEFGTAASRYAIEPFGSGLYSIPVLGLIYLTGINNNRHKKVALTGLKAYLISGGTAVVAKHLFHRHRPGDHDPPDAFLWDGPYPFRINHTALPSGHTTTAFAIASVLAHGYKDKLWIGIAAYSVATLVGISRINDGKHWATDVLTGAALGTFIGTVLSRLNFKENSDFSLSLYERDGINGFCLTFSLD
jgi:membrane-associated phospholipid phosphatase